MAQKLKPYKKYLSKAKKIKKCVETACMNPFVPVCWNRERDYSLLMTAESPDEEPRPFKRERHRKMPRSAKPHQDFSDITCSLKVRILYSNVNNIKMKAQTFRYRSLLSKQKQNILNCPLIIRAKAERFNLFQKIF